MTGELDVVKTIVPKYMVRLGKIYYIDKVKDRRLITVNYKLMLEKGKIESMLLNGSIHPNCDPKTSQFCLPDFIKEIDITENTDGLRNHIERLLKTFYLDNCYFTPWKFVEWSE